MDGQTPVSGENNSSSDVTQDSGETIMLQLDDTGQHILQEEFTSEEASQPAEPSVTYQIIAQQMTDQGQMQLTLSDGVNIIQTTMSTDQLQSLEVDGAGLTLEETYSVVENPDLNIDEQQFMKTETDHMTTEPPQAASQSERLLQTDMATASQSVNMLEVLNSPTVLKNEKKADDCSEDASYKVTVVEKWQDSNAGKTTLAVGTEDKDMADSATEDIKVDFASLSPSNNTEVKVITPKVKVIKKPDLSRPIEVTDHMEVMVKGKKCLLKVNPDTGQLCAYPLIVPGKKRGRPRKSGRPDTPESKPDNIDSAAEGLLELSNTGPDGIRRSNRRNRGKPRTLTDYEVFEVSSDDDAAVDDAEDEVLPSGAVRKRKVLIQKEYIPTTPIQVPGVRRSRGRPRRYPRPEDSQPVNQIPAMIIPSSDGQTIMMAPIQGVSNLEAFQDQIKNLTFLQSGSQFLQSGSQALDDDGSQYLNLSGQVDSAGDGTMVSIQLEGMAGTSNTNSTEIQPLPDTPEKTVDVAAAATTDVTATSTTDGDHLETADDVEEDNILTTNKADDLSDITEPPVSIAGITGNDALLAEVKHIAGEQSVLTDLTNNEEPAGLELKTEVSQPTIIRIPENLLPMFTQKKEPVTLGLRATDLHLEKLKCSRCDFQGYYEQQYQEHIATHTDQVHKCKCCRFVAFEKDELVAHFKKNHPRCICNFCDHMAEQAYIIKRHTMRHTQEGCKCEVCGKVYKDQYVLKMHVKMVHMPAEVLFECNICFKKFTRKAHLKRHLRIHDPEKPFKCPHPQCNYRGCEKSDISKHLLIHEDPKHECEVCNKTFRHVKNKDLHMKRHSGQRDYKCGVCDFYGYTFTDIRKHIERKHTDNKTFICDKCGALFRNETAYIDHRSQSCDVFMIEQALAIATSDGGTAQATIQIPSNFSLDGQHIQVDGQAVSIDKDGQITVGQPSLPGEGMITLTEEQIQAVASGQLTEADLQNLVSQNQLNVADMTHGEVNQGQVTQGQSDGEMMTDISAQDRPTQIQTLYKGIAVEAANGTLRPAGLVYKSEDNGILTQEEEEIMVTLAEEEEGEATMDEEEMEGIVSDSDDKTGIMGMVNIMR